MHLASRIIEGRFVHLVESLTKISKSAKTELVGCTVAELIELEAASPNSVSGYATSNACRQAQTQTNGFSGLSFVR